MDNEDYGIQEARELLLEPEEGNPPDSVTTKHTVAKRGRFRYVIALLLAFGFIMDYVLRINISFALDGGMVPDNCTHSDMRCWSQQTQGYILSSYLWGYWVTQLPGALVTCYFGASKVFGVGLVIAIIASALCPVVSGLSLGLFMLLRIFVGLGQGVTFPVALSLITSWAPLDEVGLFTAIGGGGQYLGAVLANAISGILAGGTFMGGWPSVFYVFSGLGVVWTILWFVFVTDNPQSSRWTAPEEKICLEASCAKKKPLQLSEIPWKDILTCVPFWSTAALHTCNGYGFFMLLTDLPKFIKEVLHFDIKNSGFIGSVPYLMIYLGYTSSGYMSDKIISWGLLSKTWTRKYASIFAMFIPAILLASLSFVEHTTPILVLMNIAMYFQGYANSCYYVNYMDLSPRYSAMLCGIGNGMCAVAGLIGPVFIGWLINDVDMTDDEKVHAQWRKAFLSASVIWTLGTVQYCIFGSAEVQSWDGSVPAPQRKNTRISYCDDSVSNTHGSLNDSSNSLLDSSSSILDPNGPVRGYGSQSD